uniref:Uncharacterized protein n=1 Tax=Meloidogyne floridensis TaxID=298350 RepID=A0A915PE07_9BILA
MKKFLLFLLFYFLINQFQIHFTDGMDCVYEIQTLPSFSLTEIHSLIVILENITLEILQQFSNVRLEIIIDYYCHPVALACKKIKKVVSEYNDTLCKGDISENERNHYLSLGLFVFARKFIRSFFNLHGTNKYYDNLVYDLYEAKANEWIIEIKKWDEHQMSLEYVENSNILPTSMVSIENQNYINRVINEEVTYEECIMFNRACMFPGEKNTFRPFHLYFNWLDENVRLKLEHHLINPFLIDKKHEKHRNNMFEFYKKFEGDYVNYNHYLPQSRIQITIHIRNYCWNFRNAESQSDQSGGHGHRSGHSGGRHSKNKGGRGEGHNYRSGYQSGYGEGQSYYFGGHGGNY